MPKIEPRWTPHTDETGETLLAIEAALYDTLDAVPPGASFTMDFGGVDDANAAHLYEQFEARVVRFLAKNQPAMHWIARESGLGRAHDLWWLDHVQRTQIAGLSTEPTRPGDFDLVLGRVNEDQTASVDELTLVEVKLGKLSADGSARFPSGTGTKQSRQGLSLGFDRALLVHVIVRPAIVHADHARTFHAFGNLPTKQELHRQLVRTAADLGDAPFGYIVIGIGQAPGRSIERTGAVNCLPGGTADFRPIDNALARANRAVLRRELLRLIGPRRTVRGHVEIDHHAASDSADDAHDDTSGSQDGVE